MKCPLTMPFQTAVTLQGRTKEWRFHEAFFKNLVFSYDKRGFIVIRRLSISLEVFLFLTATASSLGTAQSNSHQSRYGSYHS